jgi:hypothetical protein
LGSVLSQEVCGHSRFASAVTMFLVGLTAQIVKANRAYTRTTSRANVFASLHLIGGRDFQKMRDLAGITYVDPFGIE